jgi:hypothetical protein
MIPFALTHLILVNLNAASAPVSRGTLFCTLLHVDQNKSKSSNKIVFVGSERIFLVDLPTDAVDSKPTKVRTYFDPSGLLLSSKPLFFTEFSDMANGGAKFTVSTEFDIAKGTTLSVKFPVNNPKFSDAFLSKSVGGQLVLSDFGACQVRPLAAADSSDSKSTESTSQ